MSKLDWITTCLCNDESSSDTELRAHFVSEGLSEAETDWYMAQRERALGPGSLHFKLVPFGGE